MAGRGRGRGALGRWGPPPGSGYSSEYDGKTVASVPPLKKELPSALNSNCGSNETRMCCVRITCIIDVNHFWAQLGSDSELEHFDNYVFALNHWCDNQIPAPLNDMPGVGQVVCVKHAATRTWRRAEVTRLCQRMVDVFFLDFGEAQCVPLDMLCSNVPGDITSWPPQALYCTLEGIQPPRGEDQWSEKAVRRFTELVTSGPRVTATRESGKFQLILYLTDDMGHLKSVGAILAEEGFAQETNAHGIPREEALWSEESPVQHQQDQRTIEKPDLKSLDKLEQQLVMSGFSYLIPNKSKESENKIPEGYNYERTTISSSYYSYKGKGEDSQQVLGSNNEQESAALTSQYHSSFKHFQSPITQVLPSSNSLRNFAPIREGTRNHPSAIGNHHLSTRPHLASPGEFMSSSKAHSQVKTQDPVTTMPVEGKQHRYIPPPLRMNQSEEERVLSSSDVSQQSSWYNNSCSLVNNTWSPSAEQSFPNTWPSVPHDDMSKNIPFGSGNDFSYDSQCHETKAFSQQADSSFQEAQDAAAALQQHLEGPSAFHDPKNNQQTFPSSFILPIKSEKGVMSQLQASAMQQQQLGKNQQQSPISKPQPPSNDEKTMKKELSWQKWKFQRNVKRVLEKMTKENIDDLSYDIGTLISESKLSQNFEGVSEVMLVLEMIVEKVLDKKGFSNSAARICHALSGLDILRFPHYFCEVMTTSRDNIVQHYTISDWKHRCQRFCRFLGEVLLSLCQSESELDESFKSVVDTLVKQSLEKWSNFEQDISEIQLSVFVVCFVSLLRVIGPNLEDGSSRLENIDIDQIFNSVRENVLSTSLPRSVRNDLLDLMLLRAAGWPDNPQESDNDSCDDGSDGVVVEQEGSQEDDLSPNDDVLEDWSQNEDEGWDPYAKVLAMLQKLKLENLFEKFKENCIRDSLLVANKEDLKKTLQVTNELPDKVTQFFKNIPGCFRHPGQKMNATMHFGLGMGYSEAGFAPGVILEIRMYLEKVGDLRTTTGNTSENRSNELRITATEASASSEGQNTSSNNIEPKKEQPTRRNDAFLENSMKLGDENRGRCENPGNNSEELSSQKQEEAKQETNHRATGEIQSTFDPNGPSYLRQSSKNDRRKTTLEHTSDDSKIGIMDAHNLFEPSYLSRPLPLKVDTTTTTTYEYEAGPDSPCNQGPKSYSAVVKSKNEEHSPEAATKVMPVKLTSLTKAASGDGSKDPNQAPNKPALGKNAPKEAAKENPGKREQGPSASRPPPGFPPLPPQNWGGQSPEIRLTVLNSRQRGRSDEGGAGGSLLGGIPDGRGIRNREGGGMTRGGSYGGRGGTASRGRFDNRWRGGSDDMHSASQNWQGKFVAGSSNWRQRPETRPQDEPNSTRNRIPHRESGFASASERKMDSLSNISYGGGFSQNQTEPLKPFGESGPKACFNCGSKDHFNCHDRSKMFFD